MKSSGKHNFEGARISVPSVIRYDRFKVALGNKITSKEERVLELLQFGMPLDCDPNYGVKKTTEESPLGTELSKRGE